MRVPALAALVILGLAGLGCSSSQPSQPTAAPPCDCGAGAAESPAEAPVRAEATAADDAPLAISPGGTTPLPRPRLESGRPLMEALRDRRSTRSFADKALPAQILSDLLWAAAGVNRPESGKRTAPSAHDRQEIDLYVATAEGLFLYEPGAHALKTLSTSDLRALTGTQAWVAGAAVNLVYVADRARMHAGADEADVLRTTGADAAFMAQNVYLFCASEGLATVVRGSIDRAALGAAMHLRDDQSIVLAQTVGYEAAEP